MYSKSADGDGLMFLTSGTRAGGIRDRKVVRFGNWKLMKDDVRKA